MKTDSWLLCGQINMMEKQTLVWSPESPVDGNLMNNKQRTDANAQPAATETKLLKRWQTRVAIFFFNTHRSWHCTAPRSPPPPHRAPRPHSVCDYWPCQCWHHILTIARLFRLKQNVYFVLDSYAWTTFSHSHLHVATNPTPEIPKV